MNLREQAHHAHAAMRHEAAILAIAEEFHLPLLEVRAAYDGALSLLLQEATVVEFVPVLAEKRLRAMYRPGKAVRQHDLSTQTVDNTVNKPLF